VLIVGKFSALVDLFPKNSLIVKVSIDKTEKLEPEDAVINAEKEEKLERKTE
jgi:hypothetical protein